jgi:hypothetical protein
MDVEMGEASTALGQGSDTTVINVDASLEMDTLQVGTGFEQLL